MNVTKLVPTSVMVIGAGPAGLMAAEVLALAGHHVLVFDAMPSAGRKFLLAGKGGLNLTHSESIELFLGRLTPGQKPLPAALESALRAFDGQAVRDWAESLGISTFVGTSGRVFPSDMKAAPLLRAWLHRLRSTGVTFHMRHRWTGQMDRVFNDNMPDVPVGWSIGFDSPAGLVQHQAQAVVLALGGGSWARLGSDGAWSPWLQSKGVAVSHLQPSNCGFDVRGGWSSYFVERYAGQPFKSVVLRFQGFERRGEFVATASGVEGSLIYAVSAPLRDTIEREGQAVFELDLLPDHSLDRVLKEVQHPRGARSLANHLKSRLGLEGLKLAVLFEHLGRDGVKDAKRLAQAIKALPITVSAARPLDEAISTAGGVAFAALNDPASPEFMLQAMPGVFCAGEMLDWEAPTGGYLLTTSLATGRAAGQGVLRYLQS